FKWEKLTSEEVEELKLDVNNECAIMSKLRNPFVANYIGAVTYIPQVSMVMQFFLLGSLGEYVRNDSDDYIKLSYKLKLRILYDTARGMEFLHENKIVHLDLKPDNLLVNSLFEDSACCVKITDFGTSRFIKKTWDDDKGLGTPIYAAPETYNDIYTTSGDVYSFAITSWEIFYQQEPFKQLKTLFDVKSHVLSGKRLNIDQTMPVKLKSLIEGCWKEDPNNRYQFTDICKLFVKIYDEVDVYDSLNEGVNTDKIKSFVEKRQERMRKMLED
ncbi:protein kinase domain containing protein, partial [Entamoeba invadens IP1]